MISLSWHFSLYIETIHPILAGCVFLGLISVLLKIFTCLTTVKGIIEEFVHNIFRFLDDLKPRYYQKRQNGFVGSMQVPSHQLALRNPIFYPINALIANA